MCAKTKYLDAVNDAEKAVKVLKSVRHELDLGMIVSDGINMIEEGLELIQHTMSEEIENGN